MSSLEIPVTPEAQGRAARLALALTDGDQDRVGLVLDEIRAAGMDAALASNTVSASSLSASLVARFGEQTARRILEATVLQANEAAQWHDSPPL
ncbi:hypothetical protein [Mycobacteroides abscessus]|uniref:hypothetical protein n=1 Tax=Mycobacteroides abscessus TaxID=36809 RepID=UPI000C2664FA|nr:hypothetical protein [Mycobacteroides abscessus]RIU26776.1 hypothetical protein D2E89_04025 [Mycobacteroides abscessus]